MIKLHVKMCDVAAARTHNVLAEWTRVSNPFRVLPLCRAILIITDSEKSDNLVLVRTGGEAGLSAVFDFQSVEQFALALG